MVNSSENQVNTEPIEPPAALPDPEPIEPPAALPDPEPITPITQEEEEILILHSDLRIFRFEDLETATESFCLKNRLGKGRHGYVYKGLLLDDGEGVVTRVNTSDREGVIAVKRVMTNNREGNKQWITEIRYLAMLHHPHVIKLIGYCREDNHRMLVYEYLPNGSLDQRLFENSGPPLSWENRIKVALGIAKSLAFLHCEDDRNLILHRDVKSANVLLDANYNAKISDFGFAKDGERGDRPIFDATGAYSAGYTDRQYNVTGHVNSKIDIYGFGAILFELLSGRRAMDNSRCEDERDLVIWARALLEDRRDISLLLDSNMTWEQTSLGQARKIAKLARRCVRISPRERPSMVIAVQTLESLHA